MFTLAGGLDAGLVSGCGWNLLSDETPRYITFVVVGARAWWPNCSSGKVYFGLR